MSSSTTQFKFTYFTFKALGEVSRVLFALANQEYENVRLSSEEWPKYKQQMILEQLPVLDVTENGKTVQIAQSNAIERYLATRFNLFGKNEIEKAKIDMIAEQSNDMLRLLGMAYNAIYFKRPGFEHKKDDLENAYSELVPVGLKFIERLFEQNQRETNNSGFLVGSDMSYADVKLVNLYDWFNTRRDEILDQVPLLKAHAERVRNSPQLKAYYEKSDKDLITIYF